MNIPFLNKLIINFKLSDFRSKRHEFYEQLASSYNSKEAIRDFLNEELMISNNPKTRDVSRAYALNIIRNRLAVGDNSKFSILLRGVMPPVDSMMLSALDDAPDKALLMRKIANSILQQRKLIAIIKAKVIPPLLILPGAFAFSYVMATKSMPIIIKIAPPEVWTFFNYSVRLFAEIVAGYGLMAVGIIVMLAMFFVYQLPRWIGPMRSRFERVKPNTAALLFPVAPYLLPLSIYRDVQTGLMLSTLSVMLQSGRTLTDALLTIQNSSQPWMKWQVKRILAHLEVHTTEYTQAFSKGLISPQLLARLSSQIRTNPRFDQVLISIGESGGEEVQVEVEKQTAKINLMLLMAGAFSVVFMMIGQLSISQSMTDEMSPQKRLIKKMKKQQEMQQEQGMQK